MISSRKGKTEKIPTCITELTFYHPFLENCETAESLLMQLGECGQYLIRPSSSPDVYTLSVRTKSSVKHFSINVTNEEIVFGMAKFKKFADFIKHFENRPLLGSTSGEPALLKFPLQVPKHKTFYEPLLFHAQMLNDSSAEDPYKKSGYLIKQGGFVKTWKERWCVVDGYSLKYYQRQGDSVPKGIIDLRDCTFCRKEVHSGEVPGKEYVFLLGTPWRIFVFEAATLSDLESWSSTLQDCLETIKKLKS